MERVLGCERENKVQLWVTCVTYAGPSQAHNYLLVN